jgi:PTH1 family peptidyl-tRNA hydrolase
MFVQPDSPLPQRPPTTRVRSFFRALFGSAASLQPQGELDAVSPTKMIVGLGNPGPRYAATRHNIGFQTLELLAKRHTIALDKMQHKAMTGQGWISRGGERAKVILVKPLTFMNLSGESVAPLARFYQVEPSDILVIHDDLDLESGKLRLRPGGSSGGQNGIKSIIEKLGTQEFGRMRVGIGRPPGRMDPAAWVLQDFSAAEQETFGPLRERAADAIEAWLFDGMTTAMNRFNGEKSAGSPKP